MQTVYVGMNIVIKCEQCEKTSNTEKELSSCCCFSFWIEGLRTEKLLGYKNKFTVNTMSDYNDQYAFVYSALPLKNKNNNFP